MALLTRSLSRSPAPFEICDAIASIANVSRFNIDVSTNITECSPIIGNVSRSNINVSANITERSLIIANVGRSIANATAVLRCDRVYTEERLCFIADLRLPIASQISSESNLTQPPDMNLWFVCVESFW